MIDVLLMLPSASFLYSPSVFWIGLGGSLERPSHSIDLAEMRRYCIMYYQQSYVLILSHEMALIPFTYHLNFNLCERYAWLYPAFGKVSRSCLILRAKMLDFCPTFANDSYCNLWNRNPIWIINTRIASVSRTLYLLFFVTDSINKYRRHDLAKPDYYPHYQA